MNKKKENKFNAQAATKAYSIFYVKLFGNVLILMCERNNIFSSPFSGIKSNTETIELPALNF